MEPDLFEQLIQISRKAVDESHYNTSYHALAAALHYAQDEGNIERLRLVESIASKQLEWIDENARDYEHSSRSVALRNGHNIFESLARQAARGVTLIKSIQATHGR